MRTLLQTRKYRVSWRFRASNEMFLEMSRKKRRKNNFYFCFPPAFDIPPHHPADKFALSPSPPPTLFLAAPTAERKRKSSRSKKKAASPASEGREASKNAESISYPPPFLFMEEEVDSSQRADVGRKLKAETDQGEEPEQRALLVQAEGEASQAEP